MRDLRSIYQDRMENDMKSEDFPALETRILEASRKKRAAHVSAPKHLLRGAAACACAAAVVLGSTFLFPAAPSKLTAHTASAGSAKNAGIIGNSFGLTIYADAAETSSAPAVSAKNADGIKAFNFSGAENITDFGHRRVIQDFRFDLSCEGSNIQSLKYGISGGAKFAISEDADEHSGNPYEFLPREKTLTSFTAKPGESLEKYRIRCEAPITAQEEATLKAEKDGTLYTRAEAAAIIAREKAGEDTSGDLGPGYTIHDVKINDVLNGTIVSVTATFRDGTTQTARYQLSAVKNYLDAVRADHKAHEQLEKSISHIHGLKDGTWVNDDPNGLTEEEYNAKCAELDAKLKLYCIIKLK